MRKKPRKSFVMIGTGNLAIHLTKALLKNFSLLQVIGTQPKSTKKFATQFGAECTNDVSEINVKADVYFICVPDDQIEQVAKNLLLDRKLVLHCSGSTEMKILQECSENFGVMYPLYTFSALDTKVDFKKIPIFVEGSNAESEFMVKEIARSLSSTVKPLNSVQRKKLHLAAVFSSNFSNYLFDLAHQYLEAENLDKFNDLLPLMEKSISKLHEMTPRQAQTGPAKRKDKRVISNHLKMLEKYPEHHKIYSLVSKLIFKRTYN